MILLICKYNKSFYLKQNLIYLEQKIKTHLHVSVPPSVDVAETL